MDETAPLSATPLEKRTCVGQGETALQIMSDETHNGLVIPMYSDVTGGQSCAVTVKRCGRKPRRPYSGRVLITEKASTAAPAQSDDAGADCTYEIEEAVIDGIDYRPPLSVPIQEDCMVRMHIKAAGFSRFGGAVQLVDPFAVFYRYASDVDTGDGSSKGLVGGTTPTAPRSRGEESGASTPRRRLRMASLVDGRVGFSSTGARVTGW